MIEHWVVNSLIFSIMPLIYVTYNLYKDNKKQQHIIEVQNKYIENLTKK